MLFCYFVIDDAKDCFISDLGCWYGGVKRNWLIKNHRFSQFGIFMKSGIFVFPVFSDSWIIITIIVAGSLSSVDVLVTNQDMTSGK